MPKGEIGAAIGGHVGKTALAKSLNKLAEDEVLHCKTYSMSSLFHTTVWNAANAKADKQVIYVIKQNKDIPAASSDQARELDGKITQLVELVKSAGAEKQRLSKSR